MLFPFEAPTPPYSGTTQDWLTYVVGIIVLAVGGWSTYKNARSTNRRTEQEGSISLLTEYREALEDLRAELATERTERKGVEDRLTARIDGLISRERLRDDYIQSLRRHISEGLPPPPPEWPPGLLNNNSSSN